jgi:mannose-6-phosphate isomerase-like protein (cupin superfamily)
MKHEPQFEVWTEYFGALATTVDTFPDGSTRTSTIYGFETVTDENSQKAEASIPEQSGAVYGFVSEGVVYVSDPNDDGVQTRLRKGQYFAVSAPARFDFSRNIPSRVVAIHATDFTPYRTFGGPIEPKGRLRYIDRCSDSLLIAPPRLGDPCFNLLHFPAGIHQTAHTHPSVRCGAIASGEGYCINGDGVKIDLKAGMVWVIPVDVVHSFHTGDSGSELNVIAYHPDSDWGPQDENHPMLNRTWVDGKAIDNTTEQHLDPDVMKFG